MHYEQQQGNLVLHRDRRRRTSLERRRKHGREAGTHKENDQTFHLPPWYHQPIAGPCVSNHPETLCPLVPSSRSPVVFSPPPVCFPPPRTAAGVFHPLPWKVFLLTWKTLVLKAQTFQAALHQGHSLNSVNSGGLIPH